MSKFDDLIESVFGSLVSEQESRQPQQTPVDHYAAKGVQQAQRGNPDSAKQVQGVARKEKHLEDKLKSNADRFQRKEQEIANKTSHQINQMRA